MSGSLIELTDLASDQWGLFTTAQAERLGVDRARLAYGARTGRFERLAHGVYAVAGAHEDHLTHLRAAFLGTNPRLLLRERQSQSPLTGVVSHGSAASVHGFGNLRALSHEFTFPQRKTSRRTDVVLHRADLPEVDVTILDGLPVTTVERTAADLLLAGVDDDHVSDFLADASRAGRVHREKLVRALEPVAATRGRRPGLMVAELVPGGTPPEQGVSAAALKEMMDVANMATRAALGPMLAEIADHLAPLRDRLEELATQSMTKIEAVDAARHITAKMPPAQVALLVDELNRYIAAARKHASTSAQEGQDNV